MTAVVIEVRGGVVRAVRSNNPDALGVTLIDWDNIAQGDLPMEYGVEPLEPSDSVLLLGVEGDKERMAQWFTSQGAAMPEAFHTT
jgi:hypothetical protein